MLTLHSVDRTEFLGRIQKGSRLSIGYFVLQDNTPPAA
jgi:hypothetical protein